MQSDTKFDPNCHMSIVGNYRAQWKTITTDELKLTDEVIFNTWRDNLVTDDGTFDFDMAVYNELKSLNDELTPVFRHTPVTTLAVLNSLDLTEILQGYMFSQKGDPEPGANSSRAFHHGWRTKMMDLNVIPTPPEHTELVRQYVASLNGDKK